MSERFSFIGGGKHSLTSPLVSIILNINIVLQFPYETSQFRNKCGAKVKVRNMAQHPLLKGATPLFPRLAQSVMRGLLSLFASLLKRYILSTESLTSQNLYRTDSPSNIYLIFYPRMIRSFPSREKFIIVKYKKTI